MRPSGHFISSVALSAGVYAATRSPELAAGVFVGGFLIDLDHVFDYCVIGGPRPLNLRSFLDHFAKNRFEKVVLPFHAYELMAGLVAFNLLSPHAILTGFLMGATMHFALDLTFNGSSCRSIIAFYSFIYRARHGFRADRMLRPEARPAEGSKEADAPSPKQA